MRLSPSIFLNRVERRAAFDRTDLYPVVTSSFCLGRDPVSVFELLAKGGAKIIQIREKSYTDKRLYDLICACRPIANDYGVLLMVDDRVDLALAAHADGVHLGQDDVPIEAARRVAPELLLGISTHNRDEIGVANQSAADYINIGPVFSTQTKAVPYQALGMERLAELIALVERPFTVMGGIKQDHLADLAQIGVNHVALVTAVTQSLQPDEQVREFRFRLQKSREP